MSIYDAKEYISKAGNELLDDLQKARELIGRMKGNMRRIEFGRVEWDEWNARFWSRCPDCLEIRETGHKADCELKKLIDEAEEILK